MFSVNGRYGIIFNGEIYNFLELKDELHKLGHTFSSKSDTEIILNGYIEWGSDVCTKLIGMFAFCIVDFRDNSLFLGRDRLGEKPLFYFSSSNLFAFGSELKALTHCVPFSLDVNQKAFQQYLTLNYVPENHTLLKNIFKLPPASWMKVNSEGLEIETYWHPSHLKTYPSSFSQENYEDKLEELLDASVSLSVRSDVPITLALSGGIDSSLIGYYGAKQGVLTEAYWPSRHKPPIFPRL